MSELRKRVMIAVLFLPPLLWILFHGGIPLVALFGFLTIFGSYEYITMMNHAKIAVSYNWIVLQALVFAGFVFSQGYDIVILVFSLLFISTTALVRWEQNKSLTSMFAVVFGLIYTAVFPALMVKISLVYHAQKILLALILMIWIVDSVAYFVGMKYGKHRNVIKVSPQKSLEGFVAGCLAPLFIVVIYYFVGYRPLSMINLALVAVAAGIVGQVGDLVESMLKRFCNVKDSSNIIPGHGGILDRMDSALLSGAFLYCALVLIN
ncbi:MAG: phosphatidate cytidylyltransferase [Candidatus Cloacimonetes bacterium HGW-Cloacimonetes-1]|jgi:phosphatidate cytidylyltransferase|nr:MAG: phosphatidate cytidylyltransferase [Candidatus Cloacimonetes bacterium HGW-Cloacimonetes-1]